MAWDESPKPPKSYVEEKCIAPAKEHQQKAYTLVLYTRKSCPYCQRVIDYLAEEGKTLAILDADETPGIIEDLMHIGGKKQVPCLTINGEAMYESRDIINWLKANRDSY